MKVEIDTKKCEAKITYSNLGDVIFTQGLIKEMLDLDNLQYPNITKYNITTEIENSEYITIISWKPWAFSEIKIHFYDENDSDLITINSKLKSKYC